MAPLLFIHSAGGAERNGGDESKIGEFVRFQMQFVLEQKRYRNIDEATAGRTEGQRYYEDA